MKKLLLILSLFIPFTANALAADVKTVEAEAIGHIISYEGTTDNGVYAVMCKLYDSDSKEIDMLSSEVDNGTFEDSFLVNEDGTYTVSCANYEGGKFVSSEVLVGEDPNAVELEGMDITIEKPVAGMEVTFEKVGEESNQEPKLKIESTGSNYEVPGSYIVKGICSAESLDCLQPYVGKIIGGEEYFIFIVAGAKEGYKITDNTVKNIKINGQTFEEKDGNQIAFRTSDSVSIVIKVTADYNTDIKPVDENNVNDVAAADALKDLLEALIKGEVIEGNSETLIGAIGDAIANGDLVEVSLVFDEIKAENLSEEEKTLIDNEIKNNAKLNGDTILGYLDARIVVKINGVEQNETIHMLNKPMSINIDAKDTIEGLPQPEKGKVFEFKVLRIHDGKVEVIDASYDAKTGLLSFESDRFSTYAVTYNYVDAPKTVDSIVIYIGIFAVALAGLYVSTKYLKKKLS